MISSFRLSSSPYLFGKYKLIQFAELCQQFHSYDPKVSDSIAFDPVKEIGLMTAAQRKLLNCLMYWSNQGKEIHIRQDTLAEFAGYKCREQANRFIKQLCELGIIAKLYRHKTSCLYKISSFFNDLGVRSKLKRYLSQLGHLPIWLLQVDVTQYISTNLLVSNRSNEDYLKEIQCASAREEKRESSVIRKKLMIKQYVECIQNPEMTTQDKIQLSKYSEKAVRHALIQLQRQRELRNPIGFLMACAKSFDSKGAKYKSAEVEPIARKEPIYRILTKEEQDTSRLKKLVCAAEARGESEEYIADLLIDFSPIVQIENAEWERVKFLANNKANDEKRLAPFNLGTLGTVRDKTSRTLKVEPVTTNRALRYTDPISSKQESTQRSIGELIKEQFNID